MISSRVSIGGGDDNPHPGMDRSEKGDPESDPDYDPFDDEEYSDDHFIYSDSEDHFIHSDSDTETVEDEEIAFDYGQKLGVHARMLQERLATQVSEDEQSIDSETEMDRYYELNFPPGFLRRRYYPNHRLLMLFRVFMYERIHGMIPRAEFEESINVEYNVYLTSEQREHMLERFNRILHRQFYWLY